MADQFRSRVAVRHADRLNVSEFAAGDMRRRSFATTAVTLGLFLCGVPAAGPGARAQSPGRVAVLAQQAEIKAALDSARTGETQTIADQIRFCEVPAPPFNESARAQVLRDAFMRVGLENVRVDQAGNVVGERRGASQRPHLMIAAHLDTVFPPETNVKVSRNGAVLRGPGIGDNCRGLAVLVAIARALSAGRVRTQGSITFVANVGEEGLGDLRGVKALFAKPTVPIDRFVSIDGGGVNISNVAVGSHRYRVTFKGPGGHSYGAFGLANPVGALGRAVAKLSDVQVPMQPKTTFTIGRIGGGTSVNSIPFEAWMEVDMRSSSAGGAGRARHEVSHRRRRGGGGGEPALVAPRDDYGRQGARRRSARRRDSVSVAHCPDGAGGGTHPWARTRAQRRLHRREPSYQSENSGDHHWRRRLGGQRPRASANRSIRPTRGRAHRTPSCSRSRWHKTRSHLTNRLRRERATRTERAGGAARERACRGVRGAKPLGKSGPPVFDLPKRLRGPRRAGPMLPAAP